MAKKFVRRADAEGLAWFLGEYELDDATFDGIYDFLSGIQETIDKALQDAAKSRRDKLIDAVKLKLVEKDTKSLLDEFIVGPSSIPGTIEVVSDSNDPRFTPHEVSHRYSLDDLVTELCDELDGDSPDTTIPIVEKWLDKMTAATEKLRRKVKATKAAHSATS